MKKIVAIAMLFMLISAVFATSYAEHKPDGNDINYYCVMMNIPETYRVRSMGVLNITSIIMRPDTNELMILDKGKDYDFVYTFTNKEDLVKATLMTMVIYSGDKDAIFSIWGGRTNYYIYGYHDHFEAIDAVLKIQ